MHARHYKLLSQVQRYLMDIGFFNLLSNEIRTLLNHTWGWYPNPNGPYPSIAKTTNSIQLDFGWSKSAASSTSKYPSFLSDRASGSPFFLLFFLPFFLFLSFLFLLSTRYNVWYVRKEQNSGTDRLNLSPKKSYAIILLLTMLIHGSTRNYASTSPLLRAFFFPPFAAFELAWASSSVSVSILANTGFGSDITWPALRPPHFVSS